MNSAQAAAEVGKTFPFSREAAQVSSLGPLAPGLVSLFDPRSREAAQANELFAQKCLRRFAAWESLGFVWVPGARGPRLYDDTASRLRINELSSQEETRLLPRWNAVENSLDR